MQKQFPINDKFVNALVTEIQAGKEEKFDDLYNAVRSLIRREARKASTETGIPAEEFESWFNEALWTATREWDGRTSFMQRFVKRMQSRRIDVIRSNYSAKNKGINFGALSLDKQVVDSEEDEAATFLELMEDESAEILPAMIERETRGQVADLLRSFAQKNERYAKAVYLRLVRELEGDRLAQALGYEKYDANARQLVSRAVAAFAKYAKESLAA